jgi:hypothetical protein
MIFNSEDDLQPWKPIVPSEETPLKKLSFWDLYQKMLSVLKHKSLSSETPQQIITYQLYIPLVRGYQLGVYVSHHLHM